MNPKLSGISMLAVVAGLSAACSSSKGGSPAHGGGSGSASPSSSGSTDASPSSASAMSGANSGAGSGALANPEMDGGGTLAESGAGPEPDAGNSDAASAGDASGSVTPPPSSTGTLPGAVIGGIDYNTYCDGPVSKVAMGGYGLAAPVSLTNGVGGDTVVGFTANPASALSVGGDLASAKLVEATLNTYNGTPLVPNTVYTATGIGSSPGLAVLYKAGQASCVDRSGQAHLKDFVTVLDPSSPTGAVVGRGSMTWTENCKINGQTVAGAGCANIVGK